MAKQRKEGDLLSIWNSLFEASDFSECKENDNDFQGGSMLLKALSNVFDKLKERCEEAESQSPCSRCVRKEALKANAARLQEIYGEKSIDEIENMLVGPSQDKNAYPGDQQSMARAPSQKVVGGEIEVSEDEMDFVRATRRHAIPHKRSPVKETPRRGNVIGPERETPRWGNVIGPEKTKVSERPQAKMAVPETVCSQTPAPPEIIVISDNEETYMDPPVSKVTPTKRNVPPAHSQGKCSPILRSKRRKKSSTLKLDGRHANRSLEGDCSRDDGNNCTFTPSLPLCSSGAGSKKSPFTPGLLVTEDKTNNPGSPCESDVTLGVIKAKVITAPKETTLGDIFRTPVPSTDMTSSDLVQTSVSPLDLSSGADETFVCPTVLNAMNPKASQQHRLRAKVASGPRSAPGILNMHWDTEETDTEETDTEKPSSSKRSEEDSSDSSSVARRPAGGVHPERTDVPPPSVDYTNSAANEPSIMDIIRSYNIRWTSDEADAEDVSPRRFVSSQRAKPNRGAKASVAEEKENEVPGCRRGRSSGPLSWLEAMTVSPIKKKKKFPRHT